MKAAVMTDLRQIELVELQVPEIGPHDVLIKVMAVGICGSDLHYYEHGRIGRYVVNPPFVLGHECAGEVVAVGDKVRRVRPGDRVAVEPGVTCGKCEACKAGRYNLCPDVQFLATPPVDGAYAQYIVHREDFLFPIPSAMSYEAAALVEPFSVGIHAARRSAVQPGETIVIMGMGPVGLMAVVAARAFGAGPIIVADLEKNRLAAAQRLGATHTVLIGQDDPVRVVRSLTDGQGADVAFETAGNGKALQTAVAALRRGGRLSVVGLPPQGDISLHIPFIVDNEIQIQGVFRYANTYRDGIRFLASGMADIDAIITDRFSLEQTQEAMERAITARNETLKVMIYPNGL
ncbi:MAG: NAD(P)-dependent alcohol dehydrogenase [Cohnella sp.]|nr:NAD(P)-dependent alcohol dehydrogenase [Cohnella sp.]